MQTMTFLDSSPTLTADFDSHIARVHEMTSHLDSLGDMSEFGNAVNDWKEAFSLLLRLLIDGREVVSTHSIDGNLLNQVAPFAIDTYRVPNATLLGGHLKEFIDLEMLKRIRLENYKYKDITSIAGCSRTTIWRRRREAGECQLSLDEIDSLTRGILHITPNIG